MRVLRNIGLENYNIYNRELRKIFSIGYEDLTSSIYYKDTNHNFILVIAKEDDPPLVLEKDISRAEAFRMMNTRP